MALGMPDQTDQEAVQAIANQRMDISVESFPVKIG